MTLYVDRLPERDVRDIFEFPASTSEAAGAAFEEALFSSPTTAVQRMEELTAAESGQNIYAPGTQGSVVGRQEPDTTIVSAEQARAKVAESGLDLKIPDTGIRQGALDIIMDRKREELERQVIMASAPRSSVPLQVLAGFAASVVDPINIASAFIPVIGEARYSALLAKAGGAAGRFGVRAGVGAVEGTVGAAIVEPFVLAASSQDQADYDMADSLANIAFGTVLGGGLHSIGGFASDALSARAARAAPTADVVPVPPAASDMPDIQRTSVDVFDDSPENIQALSSRQMEQDIASVAESSAKARVLDELRAELEPVASGKVGNVADLKAEAATLASRLDTLDDTFKDRAKQFQSDGMKRKDAERAAREAIAQDRAQIEERQGQIRSALEENRQQERARAELGEVRRGVVPQAYADRVASQAEAIRQGVQRTPLSQAVRTARDVATNAGHSVRVAALRAGIAQSMRGQPVDVEDLFRMASEPEKAMESVKGKQRVFDSESEAVSTRADETAKAGADDEAELMRSAADDETMAKEVADQTGLKPDLSEANEMASKATAYSKAWQAFALCSLRT